MKTFDHRGFAFQWDSDIYVLLPKAKAGDEIHFAHRKDKKSLVVIAKELEITVEGESTYIVAAQVPNILLQRAGFIQVYHFVSGPRGNRTVNREELKVLEKEKPDDYVYEESQVLSWGYLDKRIRALEENGVGGGGGGGWNGSIGTDTTVGGVKSSNAINKIKILDDGTMEINLISLDKLLVPEETILSGGTA